MLTERANWVYLMHLWAKRERESSQRRAEKDTLCLFSVVVGAALWVYNSPLLFALLKWGKKLRNKRALCPSAAPEKGMRMSPSMRPLSGGRRQEPKLIFGADCKKKIGVGIFWWCVESLLQIVVVGRRLLILSPGRPAGLPLSQRQRRHFLLKTRLWSLIGLKRDVDANLAEQSPVVNSCFEVASKRLTSSSQLNCTMAKLLCKRAASLLVPAGQKKEMKKMSASDY